MLALIERVIVHDKGWLEEEELLDILAVAQATPGTIAINSATYVGKKVSGKWGAILGSIGVVLPSFLIITLLYPVLEIAFENERLNSVFLGIQAAVVALIANSAINIFKKGVKGPFALAIFFIALALIIFTSINPILLILFGLVAGLILSLVGDLK